MREAYVCHQQEVTDILIRTHRSPFFLVYFYSFFPHVTICLSCFLTSSLAVFPSSREVPVFLPRPRHALLPPLIAASTVYSSVSVRDRLLRPGVPIAHLFYLRKRRLLVRSVREHSLLLRSLAVSATCSSVLSPAALSAHPFSVRERYLLTCSLSGNRRLLVLLTL